MISAGERDAAAIQKSVSANVFATHVKRHVRIILRTWRREGSEMNQKVKFVEDEI